MFDKSYSNVIYLISISVFVKCVSILVCVVKTYLKNNKDIVYGLQRKKIQLRYLLLTVETYSSG